MSDTVWERADHRFARVWELRHTWRSLINAPSSRLGTSEWIANVLACWKEANKLRAPFTDPRNSTREFNESVSRLLDVYNAHTPGTDYLKSIDQPSLEIIELTYMKHIEAEYRRSCIEAENERDWADRRQALNHENQIRENQKHKATGKDVDAPRSVESASQINDPWGSNSFTSPESAGDASSLPILPADAHQPGFPEDDHKHKCICGIQHSGGIPGCYYLIPENRPAGFIIRENVLTRIKRVLTSDPSLQAYIDKARTKLHGGLVPPHEDYAGAPTATPSMVSSGALPAGSIAPSASASNWAATTTASDGSAEQAPPQDLETATYMTAKDPAGGQGGVARPGVTHALKKSWILSISCNICVCNDRSRLDDFEVAAAGTTVHAHGQELVVTGRGKAEVRVEATGGAGEQFVTFPDVWCVPDYYTNIIALDALERAGITWEHREDVLLMDGEPWCKVKRVNGMRVLEYTPLQLEIL